MKLTDRFVNNVQPDPKRRVEHGDDLAHGLKLVVQPGGAKSWAVRYRFDGKKRKLTLGNYPMLRLKEARALALAAQRVKLTGVDPAEQRQADAAARQDRREKAKALAGFAPDNLSMLLGRYRDRHLSQKRYKTRVEVERYLKIATDEWVGRPAGEITRADVVRLLEATARRAPTAANRMRSHLHHFFGWAVKVGEITVNPVAGTPVPYEERSRDRVLSNDELRWFWSATGRLGYPYGPLYRLLALTGQRLREVAEMRRYEVAGDQWVIPAERAKNGKRLGDFDVPLSGAAKAVLSDIVSAPAAEVFVFTTTGTTPVSGFTKSKARLDAFMASVAEAECGAPVDIEHWTLHDLRRTMATGLAAIGVAPHVVEAALNHRSGVISGIARVYNRLRYGPEKRRALEAWAGQLDEIVGERSVAKVVRLSASV